MENKTIEGKEITKGFFIPEDEIADNYVEYKFGIFRVVPPNAVLVQRNVFTGKLTVRTPGLKVILPWMKSRFVSTASKNIDYPEEEYKTSDGIMVNLDVALTISIINPKKFELANLNPLQELGVLTKSIMRQFIASKSEYELTHNAYKLNNIDIDGDYKEFTSKYGVEITSCYFKNIELPKSLLDDYEKQAMQDKENKRRLSEAQNLLEVAELEAKKLEISSKAEAEARTRLQGMPLEQLIDILTKSSMTMEQIQAYVIANGSNQNNKVVSILGQGNGIANVMASMEAANNTSALKPVARIKRLPSNNK